MKLKIFVLAVFSLLILLPSEFFAQYYTGTDGLYSDALKSRLHTLIRNHVRYPYTSSSTDVWDMLKDSDKDTTNAQNVILFYSGRTMDGPAEYDGGSGWSREHVWPKSHGFPDDGDTAYTDAHHLRPADISTNSARGNKDFDDGGDEYIDSGFPTGCYRDTDSWEPRAAVKGDAARMVFYMATRYQGPDYDLEVVDYTGTDNLPILGKLSTLLEWNRLDPPDDFERARNEAVFTYQNNRNPFTDHPEYVDRIYNSSGLVIEKTEAVDYNTVIVKFNNIVDAAAAETPSNYSIDGGIGSPVSASRGYGGDNSVVELTTANLSTDTDYIVTVSNLTSSAGQIADNSISVMETGSELPVELITFDYKLSGNRVTLNWRTATEVNNAGFDIEKKTNLAWEKIGFVKGNGTKASPTGYSFTDICQAQYNSYRLKQIDNDGTVSYSGVLSVEFSPVKFGLAQNYPNPFNPSTEIEFSLPVSADVNIAVFNTLGQKVNDIASGRFEAGMHHVTFNGSGLSSGVYIYTLTAAGENGETFVTSRKMALMR